MGSKKISMKTGIVCVLDALATKGAWSIDEPNVYIKKMRQIHLKLNEMKAYMKSVSRVLVLEVVTFSDTIIITLYSRNEFIPALLPYFVRSIDGIFSFCFAENLLMRGAISYGKFIKRQNIIIGPAIDDAAFWHDKGQLIGCVLTPNTSLLYDTGLDYIIHNPIDKYDNSQHAIKYNTPFKDGKMYELYNVNWPLSAFKAISSVERRNPLFWLKDTLGAYPIPPDAYNKHLNTIEFYNYSIKEAEIKSMI